MIDSEIVVGTGLRITVAKDELAAKLAIVARGVSTRTAVLVLGGIQLRAEAGSLHLAATDMEISLRATARGAGRRRRHGRRARPAAARHRALAARQRGDDRAPPRGGGRRRHVRHRELPPAHVLGRGLPAAARRRHAARCTRSTATRCRDDRARRPQRVARREPPGADRHPRPLRARQDRDGRDRLVPPRGQGDAGRRRRCPSSRRSSRPARCRSSRASPPAPTSCSSACRRTTSSSAPTAPG